jgi:hypothetical protein
MFIPTLWILFDLCRNIATLTLISFVAEIVRVQERDEHFKSKTCLSFGLKKVLSPFLNPGYGLCYSIC